MEKDFRGDGEVDEDGSLLQGLAPGRVHHPLARAVRLEDGPEGVALAEFDGMAAELAFADVALIVAGEMHAPALEPLDLLPSALHDPLHHILVGGAVPSLPGVEHVVDRFVRLVPGIDGGEPSLGGARMGFLGVGHLGDGEDLEIRPLFEEVDRTAQAGAAGPDDQDVTLPRFVNGQMDCPWLSSPSIWIRSVAGR